MSEEILDKPLAKSFLLSEEDHIPTWQTYTPALFSIVGACLLAMLRIEIGGERFVTDGALMMLALAAYLVAAVFFITHIIAPFRFAARLGMFASILGVFLNLSSWLVRWITAYDRELAIFRSQGLTSADMPWVLRYIPFANLYDLSLAFAFGAGLTTLLVLRRQKYWLVAVLALPLAALILTLARFIGSDIADLPPVLDSYWRPIHVGIASLSYGVALVCFAVAVLYLLKDGIRVEKMAICTIVFTISIFAAISDFGVFSLDGFGTYSSSIFFADSRTALGIRADVPYVGYMIVAAAALLGASMFSYLTALFADRPRATKLGTGLLVSAFFVQASGIGLLVYNLNTSTNIFEQISPDRYSRFAVWMLVRQDMPQEQIDLLGQQQLFDIGRSWITENSASLHLSTNSNPVELAALITALAAIFFVILFTLKAEHIRRLLPSPETLDGLMYKLGGTAFAGLALLLITGAVWANESWGRYWGWDAKEVGALVAWLAYAGFLHSRIAYGWRGRRSAYFALAAFVFIIFTFLGVSYLLPGLHSYA